MFNYIHLDLETIPTQRQDVRDYIAKTVTHPGNISKAETIALWNKDSRPAAVEEAVNKTGLDGAFGQVVCIGFDLHDTGEPESIYGLDEAELLARFNLVLQSIRSADLLSTTVVGHNVAGFDLRFLAQRYIVNGIRPHPIIVRAAQAKPWESEKVFDTMVQFAGIGNRISLDKLCLALGIPGKNCGTWEDVLPNALAGNWDAISAYCCNDVNITRAVFKRMTFSGK